MPNDVGELKPLFTAWLEEAAIDATKKGTKSALLYNRALQKVRQFESPILDRKTLRAIQFVGDKTVTLLIKKLRDYCTAHNYTMPPDFDESIAEKGPVDGEPPAKKQRKQQRYVPRKRSGGYAILLTLYLKDKTRQGMKKENIIKHATPYCDKSFSSNPGNSDFYSAWSSIKSLEKHELVTHTGRSPKLYFLTDEGMEMAQLLKTSQDIKSSPLVEKSIDISFDNNVRVTPDTMASRTGIFDIPYSPSPILHDWEQRIFRNISYDIWRPLEYEIVILIDNREIKSQQERNYFQERLAIYDIACEVRQLPVGDVCWIAKHKKTGREAVLNTICERKRLDDLASSIKDGRFVEQKNRLLKSMMKSYYYLVEEGAADLARFSDFAASIQTAQAMTMTVSKFKLRKFRQIDETTSFLFSLTEIIRDRIIADKRKLIVIKPATINSQEEYGAIMEQFRSEFETNPKYECVHLYSNFCATMTKTNMLTLKEVFICMLQTIRGMSLEKALRIQAAFPTPKSLLEFYSVENAHKSEAEKGVILSNVFKDEIGNKKIGKALAQKIYDVWGSV